jgi:2-C-methyl-D-erythritol 2,4-cyclodiphosphate synthase
LVHAVCDALLGAAGEGDIGKHFPPDDDSYLNISSLILLEKVKALISSKYSISNIDCTVVAERPHLAQYIEAMEARIAECLDLDAANVNVKATTNEGMGPVGEGMAIAAYAVACLQKL